MIRTFIQEQIGGGNHHIDKVVAAATAALTEVERDDMVRQQLRNIFWQESARFEATQASITDRGQHHIKDATISTVVRPKERMSEKEALKMLEEAVTLEQKLAAYQQMSSTAFRLDDGRYVTWMEATEEDHVARQRLLRKQRDGIQATLGLTDTALRILHQEQADTLQQVADNIGAKELA